MATFVLINDWLDNMVENADLASDTFKMALSNTAPGSEGTPPTGDGAGILGNVTQIAYTNITETMPLTLTTTSSSQTAGTYSLVLQDATINSTGAVATFRYVYIYDDTVATPVDPLVCYYDYGSGITMGAGESFTIDFGATLFTIS